jgi:glycosyltransferase involved in cell wall biosynthesis
MLSLAIVTRNAVHGGVETMVAQHQQMFDATVFVAGGTNHPDTCPFRYTYIDGETPARAQRQLARLLRQYDVIVYHWLPSWAQESVRQSDRPCIEVLHRDDTADNDKTIPDLVVTHSQYLGDFVEKTWGLRAEVIPHAVDVTRFSAEPLGSCVGAITSYYANKGIDLLIQAWAMLEHQFPQHRLRFYGAGSDRETLAELVQQLGLQSVDLLGPVTDPESHYSEFCLCVQPSRAEGMPFAIMEALASNVPVIASNLPAMVEFNRQADQRGYPPPLMLFQSGDAGELAQNITRCLRTPESQAHGREYINRFYGPDQHRTLYTQAMQHAVAIHEQRLAQDRRWKGWRRPPSLVAHNLYHIVAPRRVRYAVWAFRHRPSIAQRI